MLVMGTQMLKEEKNRDGIEENYIHAYILEKLELENTWKRKEANTEESRKMT